jgi:hypothetical protein
MMQKKYVYILLALVAMAGQAKDIVWEQPATEFGTSYGDGFFNLALDVTKVELKDSETVVYVTARQRSDYPDFWFQFAGDTYLMAGSQRYTIVAADGIELNKHLQTNKDGKRDMAFHFPALPKGTKSFDFIEGDGQGAFQIKGIKPVEERWKQLFPSYWRNSNGDWKIAFFEDCAIYDCKFWNYKQCDVNQKTGEATIVMNNGSDELKVVVGKDRKGSRAIQIGSEKATYAMITTRFMPDYPTKDKRTDFVDTGYRTDTVTVVGWIKDMPEYFKQLKTFDFGYGNIYTDEQDNVHADLDEQGRFSVKIPVLNSSEFFIDWQRCFIRTMFEPGKTYFMLYDFKEGRRYFMGDDCRLQNELFKFPPDWKSIRLEKGDKDFDRYIAAVDSLIMAQYAGIDRLCEEHPTLSTRFNTFRKGNTMMQQARDFGQSRFRASDFQLTADARQYAYDHFWTQLQKPYTLHRDLSGFLRDYLGDAADALNGNYFYKAKDHYKDYAANAEELALLERWAKWIDEVSPLIEAEPTIEAKIRKSQELDSLNADMMKEVNKILQSPKAVRMQNDGMLLSVVDGHIKTLDSLNADPFIRNVWLARKALEYLEHQRTSLLPNTMNTLRGMISNPDCIALIEKQNDHYLAIENREFDKLVLKSSDNLAELSEGEALLKKILEPYKVGCSK